MVFPTRSSLLLKPALGDSPNNCYYDGKAGGGGQGVGGGVRDLPEQYEIPEDVVDSIIWCRTTCGTAGYDYAGLQYAVQCFCGNEYGTWGQAPDADCDAECVDDSNGMNKCGGGWRNNVYASIK